MTKTNIIMGKNNILKHKKFYELISKVVKDGLVYAKMCVQSGKYIGRYLREIEISEWYELSEESRESGMPQFLYLINAPINYREIFKDKTLHDLTDGKGVEIRKFESFKSFKKYAESNEYLINFFNFDVTDEETTNYLLFGITTQLIDRYIHVFNSFDFSNDKFLKVYLPIENLIYSEKLSVEIVVPILFTKFDEGNYKINDTIRIEKMADDFQIARYIMLDYEKTVHEVVKGCATHALVIKKDIINSYNYFDEMDDLIRSKEVIRLIDNFFSSVRIYKGIHIGYAQILYKPVNWIKDSIYNLPDVKGYSIKKYPSLFEEGYWKKEEIPLLTKIDIENISSLLCNINSLSNAKLDIAMRRYKNAILRENEEDIIIDIAICLEALLGDPRRYEMTHKLALRAAAISRLTDLFKFRSEEIFKGVKDYYNYRSEIIHGNPKREKNFVILSSEKLSMASFAELIIRIILYNLLNNKRFLDPHKIDTELLLNKL